MKVSYNWLQDLLARHSLGKGGVGHKLPEPNKLADLLTFHSFEVKVIEKQGNDWVLDVDVLPNRAHDCLSHQGVAREIAVLLKIPFKVIDYSEKIKESNKLADKEVKIKVEDTELCPRYTARVIVDVKVGSSPSWIQDRLKACGLKSINNVVDIANYVMIETGQPLHAFDADKLANGQIIVRRAKKGEKIVSLDNEKYDLDQNILVIADQKDPVCVAGIKGGIGPGVDGETKRIIIEAANFDFQSIRNTSRQLNLKTDASWRFENELDPNLTQEAVGMCAYLIQNIASGKVLKGRIDIYPKKIEPKRIKLDNDYVRNLLGIKISNKEISDILKRLGLDKDIPTRRLDISIQEDLIEEVGRIYGFEKITSQLPSAILIPAQRSEDLIYQNKVKDILTNLEFTEVYNYSLLSDKESNSVELANPTSKDLKYLRASLIPLLIKNVKENKKYFENVQLFEIGKVFHLNKKEVVEEKKLAGILYPGDFYRLKGVLDTLLNRIGISDIWYHDLEDRKASIKVGNDLLGWLNHDAFEIDFAKLVELATEERIYTAPSKYPAMIRDIALLTDQGTKVVEVLNVINQAGGSLIRDVDLFDIYQKEDRKSLAFHIIFQSNERTLTDKEVNKLQDEIIKVLEEKGWEVRKQNA